MPEAKNGTAESKEGEVNIGPALIADAKSAELMEPAQGALDDPSGFSQAAAMRLADLGQQVLDTQALKKERVSLAAVSAVPLHDIGTPPGAAHLPPHPIQGSKHRNKLGLS